MDRLRQTTKSTTNIEVLDAQFDALRTRLVAAGFDVEPGRPDAAIMRGWRASIEARHGESQNRSERLSALAKEVADLPKMRADLASLQQQISQTEQAFGESEEKRIAAELAFQHAERRLTEMNAKCHRGPIAGPTLLRGSAPRNPHMHTSSKSSELLTTK